MSKVAWILLTMLLLSLGGVCLWRLAGATSRNDAEERVVVESAPTYKNALSAIHPRAEPVARDLKPAVEADVRPKPMRPAEKEAEGQLHITLGRENIVLERKTKTEISISRSGETQRVLHVGLLPSPGSNLRASGGLFAAGQTESRITIEAPVNARDGTVTVMAGGQIQTLSVSVRP